MDITDQKIIHLQNVLLHCILIVWGYNVVTIVTVNDSKPRRHGMC